MSTAERQALFVLPPRASQIGRYATSGTFASANLRLIGPQTSDLSTLDHQGIGAPGTYVRVTATGSDCWVAFAATAAELASLDATTAAVNGVSGCCCIPAGTYQDFRLEDIDVFIGYGTASGTGLLTVQINSPR